MEKRAAKWAPLFLAFAASKHGVADDDAEADADRAAGQPAPVAAVSRVGGRCSPVPYSSIALRAARFNLLTSKFADALSAGWRGQ